MLKGLYMYMAAKREALYASEDKTVKIDMIHFFQLYKLVCDMLQIRNLVNQDEDLEEMLKRITEERQC